jgi:hypothetical protein
LVNLVKCGMTRIMGAAISKSSLPSWALKVAFARAFAAMARTNEESPESSADNLSRAWSSARFEAGRAVSVGRDSPRTATTAISEYK